jgi:hypothetical protein
MTPVEGFLELSDLDVLLAQAGDPMRAGRWRRMGYALGPAPALVRERERLAERLDRRWLNLYERSLGRYGRGLSAVRNRVCLGCRLTLPTSAAPPPGEAQLHLCEGCGRLLLWD